jgi:hypothetical protein
MKNIYFNTFINIHNMILVNSLKSYFFIEQYNLIYSFLSTIDYVKLAYLFT